MGNSQAADHSTHSKSSTLHWCGNVYEGPRYWCSCDRNMVFLPMEGELEKQIDLK